MFPGESRCNRLLWPPGQIVSSVESRYDIHNNAYLCVLSASRLYLSNRYDIYVTIVPFMWLYLRVTVPRVCGL